MIRTQLYILTLKICAFYESIFLIWIGFFFVFLIICLFKSKKYKGCLCNKFDLAKSLCFLSNYQVVYLVSSFNKLGFTLKLIGDIYTREQLYIYAAQLLEFYEY